MTVRKLNPENVTTEAQLDTLILKISRENPDSYITYYVTFGSVRIFIHSTKPQSLNSHGVEDMIRRHGGFFKNGHIVKPSKSLLARYNYCPVSH